MKKGKGTVIKSTGSQYLVKIEDERIIPCSIKGKFRIKGIRATNPVAVGDHVGFEWLEDETGGIITSIKERSNYIIRKSSNLSKEYQLLATNVDVAWLMISMTLPRTLTPFIDRFLVSAEAYRIPVIILFNKTDLYGLSEQEEMNHLKSVYTDIGYRCMQMSLQTRKGVKEVQDEMIGKVNVISGNSGVGKSTLINVLDPSIRLKIGEVSDYHKTGKHTTTFSEMFELSSGIRIIDTPGIRGFGTIDIEREELFHFFPEIFRASKNCKYHNCIHMHEPDCGVKAGVENGSISEFRYINYLMMMEEEDGKYR
ncbi:MAG: ribosome small subunit-dependent GTPase A [Bacteroidales bacterium]|nr:ribosome small subunit-dependent GTPase A [Bacteroidales bacterium]